MRRGIFCITLGLSHRLIDTSLPNVANIVTIDTTVSTPKYLQLPNANRNSEALVKVTFSQRCYSRQTSRQTDT